MTSGAPISDDHSYTLSIGDLAARTGVSAATLRTWESRYGVPLPARLTGGHRRYQPRDVDVVGEILRRRASGQTMTSATTDVVAALDESEPSIFAGLHRRHPVLVPRVLRKKTLLALTRAIEDECCARADSPMLFVAFQQRRFYDQSRSRWRELARTARTVAIFADFERRPSRAARRPPLLVPIPSDSPLRREWALVCDSPHYPACVVGWERPGQRGSGDKRLYETIWSANPRVVRDAARISAVLADRFAPTKTPLSELIPDSTPPAASADLQRADSLLNRTLSYLDSVG